MLLSLDTLHFIPGDGIFQNRQAAADHLKLLPVLARRGGPHYRRHLRAALHCDVHHEGRGLKNISLIN